MSSFSTPRHYTAPDAFDGHLVTLWAAYRGAAAKAQASGCIEDGIAAGKAWAAWLEAFVPVVGAARGDARV